MSTFKWLGQAQPPTPGTAVKLYTGAANGSICKLMINNRGSGAALANVAVEVRIAGAATAGKDFVAEFPVQSVNPPATLPAFIIGATDEVWVISDQTGVNFNLNGIEK